MHGWLCALTGPLAGSRWRLQGELLIGRDPSCDVVVPEATVSRRHCILRANDDGMRLVDLMALNPALVNGQYQPEHPLRIGDSLSVGTHRFTIMDASSSRRSPTPTPSDATLTLRPTPGNPLATAAKVDSENSSGVLGELYALACRMAQSEQGNEAANHLIEALREHWPGADVYLTALSPSGVELRASATGDSLPRWVETSTERVTETEAGQCERRRDDQDAAIDVAAAPFLLGKRVSGAVVVVRPVARGGLGERDLAFLLAVAGIAGPTLALQEQLGQLRSENQMLATGGAATPEWVGESEAMVRVRRLLRRAAQSSLHLVVTGETGTGKEVVAQLCHAWSPRANGPFVVVNCAAIAGELIESELFGHEKGAFTDAHAERPGKLEAADGGTLFLDEIGDMPIAQQARLLRAMETGTFNRVGGNEVLRSNFRVVAATNRDLNAAMQNKEFRSDLYHRLAGVHLHLPPLREREGDVAALARHFFAMFRLRSQPAKESLAPDAVAWLTAQPWPGNVRELKRAVERAVHLCPHPVIDAAALRAVLRQGDGVASAETGDIERSLADVEREHIARVVEAYPDNLQAAAKVLGIARSTLYKKLSEYNLR